MRKPFSNAFEGLTVMITGHTGFKGSWLSIWLHELGARVIGYSLEPPTSPSNFVASRLDERVVDIRGDVRDLNKLRWAIRQHQPQALFHLAAQPIVIRSYQEPKETFDVNVGGTVNLLEAVRTTGSVRAVLCVTTDKVYENREWLWGYRENDALGGHDPYSASKAMVELAVDSYRRSFFPPAGFEKHGVAVASVRAGNVVAGGDWAAYRLVPDCMRALMGREPIQLRNPSFIRPWQSVFEPLSGYMWLAVRMLGEDGSRYAEAWNFGPWESAAVTAEQVVQKVIQLWGSGTYTTGSDQTEAEDTILRLSWDKAATRLGWRPTYTWEEALMETVGWFKRYQSQASHGGSIDMYRVCADHIRAYTNYARELEVPWAVG